jgi:hypothetical protein
MNSRTRDGNLVVGITQTTLANAPDASRACLLDPTVQGKRLTTPQPVVNHRSRTSGTDLGRAILDEAFAASSFDDRFAHGRE